MAITISRFNPRRAKSAVVEAATTVSAGDLIALDSNEEWVLADATNATLQECTHVALMDTIESFIKIPTNILCILIADINKVSKFL